MVLTLAVVFPLGSFHLCFFHIILAWSGSSEGFAFRMLCSLSVSLLLGSCAELNYLLLDILAFPIRTKDADI